MVKKYIFSRLFKAYLKYRTCIRFVQFKNRAGLLFDLLLGSRSSISHLEKIENRKSEMLYEHIVTRYHSTWCVPPGGTVIACYTCSPVPQSSSTGKNNAHCCLSRFIRSGVFSPHFLHPTQSIHRVTLFKFFRDRCFVRVPYFLLFNRIRGVFKNS